ncbi:hypothetical protein ACFQS7_29685 [Dankookia sp. GCM10030260]|uniref:hypothetical protein n=1 Tax=Dankookia sp. GCM10030260 TaxID=3273390 RepID=UPI0036072359
MNYVTIQNTQIGLADTFIATRFADHTAKEKRELSVTWDQLREAVLQTSAATKAGLPWVKLARFGDIPTPKGSLRHDTNMLAITGIEADYDGEEVTPEDAGALLEAAGVKALIYTSPSHTDAKPRWRVLCPTSVELPPDQREGLVARLNGVLGGILAGESFTLSQSYYYGCVNMNPEHRAIMVPGQPIDLCADLGAGVVGRPATKGAATSTKAAATPTKAPVATPPVARAQNTPAALLEAIISGDDFHGATVKLAGIMASGKVGKTSAKRQITDAFDAVPADQRDARWAERRADVGRCVDGIYDKDKLEAAFRKAEGDDNGGADKTGAHDNIIDAVLGAGVTFWRDPDGEVYARVPMGEGVLNIAVRTQRFDSMCRQLYGKAFPVMGSHGLRPPGVSDNAIKTAIGSFIAMGLDSKDVHVPGVRLADYDGAIWIDLGDDTHRVVRVTADGWSVESTTQAPLVRKGGMRALPVPVRADDSASRLRGLLNIASDDDFRLACAWLVAALRPTGPYAIIAVDGEQGSGKSTTSKMLRQLVDPNASGVRGLVKNEDDLLISAQNSRVVGIDNISTLSDSMSDALCRISTGAGLGKRTLYSNLDETIISVCRPIVMNGIAKAAAMRGDLADRTIALTLPVIPETERRDEGDVWPQFEAAAPGIFALLLSALATGLRRLPEVKLERKPRMADFAKLACASAPAFGWTETQMMEAIEGNRQRGTEAVIEGDAIASAVLEIMDGNPNGWSGTATNLLDALRAEVSEAVERERSWPKGAAQLSARLTRAAPALRRVGVTVEQTRAGGTGKRLWRIARAG